MTIHYKPRTLHGLTDEDREKLVHLTLLAEGASASVFHNLLTKRLPPKLHGIVITTWNDLRDERIAWGLLWWTVDESSNIGVYVHPSHRGKGIATEIVTRLARAADGLGLHPHANGSSSDAALRLFRKCRVRPYTLEYGDLGD